MPLQVRAPQELAIVFEPAPTCAGADPRPCAGLMVSTTWHPLRWSPAPERGRHTQNRSDTPAWQFILSTRVVLEVMEYPELGPVRLMTRQPFGPDRLDDGPADQFTLVFDRWPTTTHPRRARPAAGSSRSCRSRCSGNRTPHGLLSNDSIARQGEAAVATWAQPDACSDPYPRAAGKGGRQRDSAAALAKQ